MQETSTRKIPTAPIQIKQSEVMNKNKNKMV